MPVAYLTAYYALVMRGGLEKGHRVLVHSGTGAVGLAAIRICLHRGCDVSHTCLIRKETRLLLHCPRPCPGDSQTARALEARELS